MPRRVVARNERALHFRLGELPLQDGLRDGTVTDAPRDAIPADVFRTTVFLFMHLLDSTHEVLDAVVDQFIDRHEPETLRLTGAAQGFLMESYRFRIFCTVNSLGRILFFR